MTRIINRAVSAIIRPPRKDYDLSSIPFTFEDDDGNTFIRQPLEYINKRKLKLVGSYYYSSDMSPTAGGPCVIYLHGNASSQLEGQFLVPNLCKYGIYVFCFDFAGCGCSDGKYISLGYYEKEDTEYLLDQLRSQFNLGPFILWGRSMGAATSLLVDYPLLSGRISDSSYTSVSDMCAAISLSMHLPPIFVPAALKILKKQVIKRAKFNLKDVSPISVKRKIEVPALFGHSKNDKFIPFKQCEKLYIHYQSCNKKIVELEGGHNSKRSEEWIREGVCFVFMNFGIRVQNLVISTCRRLQEKVSHFSSFTEMLQARNSNTTKYVTNKNEDKNIKNKKYRNSFVIDEGCQTRKRRRSIREKEFELKLSKKHKKLTKNFEEEDGENDDNENEYYKYILGENNSSDESDDVDDEITNNEYDDISEGSNEPVNNSSSNLFTNLDDYNKFILGEFTDNNK